jgi:hypothetical protein
MNALQTYEESLVQIARSTLVEKAQVTGQFLSDNYHESGADLLVVPWEGPNCGHVYVIEVKYSSSRLLPDVALINAIRQLVGIRNANPKLRDIHLAIVTNAAITLAQIEVSGSQNIDIFSEVQSKEQFIDKLCTWIGLPNPR